MINGSEGPSDNAAKIKIETVEFDSTHTETPIILKGKYLDVKDGSATADLEYRISWMSQYSKLEMEQPKNAYHDGILFYFLP